MRTSHWRNAVAVVVLAASGWRICNPAPFFDFRSPSLSCGTTCAMPCADDSRMLTKRGCKNLKHVCAIFVANTCPDGYWEDQGHNWFGGS